MHPHTTHTCTHAHTCIHTLIHTCTHMHACAHTHMHACTHARTHARMHVCMLLQVQNSCTRTLTPPPPTLVHLQVQKSCEACVWTEGLLAQRQREGLSTCCPDLVWKMGGGA